MYSVHVQCIVNTVVIIVPCHIRRYMCSVYVVRMDPIFVVWLFLLLYHRPAPRWVYHFVFYPLIVCYYYYLDIWLSMLIHLLDPVGKVQERLLVEQIEDKHYTVSAFVVCVGDCAVSLLPSRIPNLQFDHLVINRERL